ncbi:5'-deoxynucleotidase [uncultured Pseudoflavonifractor sp.]|uniref:5'-deoxynucleotidase n=1 Tax=uncultured Pseudoflavonifractor sp. TaxID=1221379 RepID=UPI0025EB2460|nr:5'-deoxynucleotidase [uncultured Pseudoflavonifractor sp.]
MAYNFFAYIARMKYISRWGLMRNSVQENIQEHSHMVAVLAHTLAVIRRDVVGEDCDPGAAAVAALYHDAPEIFTGDLPTPVKYYNPEIRDAYKAVEAVSADKLLSMLPDQLRPAYAPWLREEYDPSLRALVKAADKLSAHIKCVEEVKAGNNEFRQAAIQTLEAVEAMNLPEAAYFIEHFLPAFGLTLDELQ